MSGKEWRDVTELVTLVERDGRPGWDCVRRVKLAPSRGAPLIDNRADGQNPKKQDIYTTSSDANWDTYKHAAMVIVPDVSEEAAHIKATEVQLPAFCPRSGSALGTIPNVCW